MRIHSPDVRMGCRNKVESAEARESGEWNGIFTIRCKLARNRAPNKQHENNKTVLFSAGCNLFCKRKPTVDEPDGFWNNETRVKSWWNQPGQTQRILLWKRTQWKRVLGWNKDTFEDRRERRHAKTHPFYVIINAKWVAKNFLCQTGSLKVIDSVSISQPSKVEKTERLDLCRKQRIGTSIDKVEHIINQNIRKPRRF